jgi:hypothetical protein
MGKWSDRAKRLMHAWNIFDDVDQNQAALNAGPATSYRGDRSRYRFVSAKTIVPAIYNRIALDVAAVPISHVRRDDKKQYKEDMVSGLNNCLTVQPNIDQGPRHFIQDLVQSLFDWGVVAIVPIDTTLNPLQTGGYDINTMRVGQVMQWYPEKVRVRVYNQSTGVQQDVTVPKSMVAIVENPLYVVMNDTSSTLQRLLRKLSLLDAVDEQSASGQLDLIIQLPYVIRTEARREEARKRLNEIEFQLKGSQYGIAYTDGTEKIVQLNRPANNNLMAQIEYLTNMLYGQLGITDTVMNGTADEATMINYYNRTIEPILASITEAMIRTFLTATGRSQGQWIMFFKDPFKLIGVKDLAEIADKMRRNEVLTANEMRAVIGRPPITDPNANKLQNPNIPVAYTEQPKPAPPGEALARPQLPPKSSLPQVKAIPDGQAVQDGEPSQNGTKA